MSQSSPAPAIEWRGITKRFGQTTALDDLSLTAHEGEFLTLLGPSGCGKTTALRLISGLETPDAGTVLLGGSDVTALPPHRREVNQVFQSYALFPHLNVFDNVAFGLRMKRMPATEIRTRVARALALVALDGLEKRRPSQLSGGQRQRVALARALVCEPRVLLLDEPLSALDARLRAQVREELRALQRSLSLTFILVTHDQEEALAVSDRIALIHRGRVEQVDTVENIYHRPASRFVAGFIGEANLLNAQLIDRTTAGPGRCRLADGSEFTVVAGTKLPSGEVLLVIRPENVRLLATDPPEDNAQNVLRMTITRKVFQGAATMLTLRGSNKISLLALHPALAGTTPDIGAPVTVQIDPEDCVLLPAEHIPVPGRNSP